MARLRNGAWVVIADGEKALILENVTDSENPYLVVLDKEEQENPPNREQAANRRGRFNDTGVQQRSAVADTDWHQLAKDRFADDLAERLYKWAHKGSFHDVVLVAAPGILGELRRVLHKEVRAKVVAEIPKTLTNHELEDIERIVSDAVQAA